MNDDLRIQWTIMSTSQLLREYGYIFHRWMSAPTDTQLSHDLSERLDIIESIVSGRTGG